MQYKGRKMWTSLEQPLTNVFDEYQYSAAWQVI